MLNSRIEDNCQIKFINPLIQGNYRLTELISFQNNWSEIIEEQLKLIINAFFEKNNGHKLIIKSSLYRIIYELISNNKFKKVNKKI